MRTYFLIFFAFPSFLATGQHSPDKLDKYLLKKMKRANLIGLQVAYLSGGEDTWQGNYGIKEWGTTDSVDVNTLFMIASCSKPVTAFGLLKLVDEGLISLDDPVNDYLPFKVIHPKFPEESITFRMLLAHVSSLQDNWEILTPLYTINSGGGDSPISLSDFVKDYLVSGGQYYEAENNFWPYRPTEHFAYSNVGYALTGLLIEEISGKPFPEYIKEEVFDPMGMENSYWMLADIPHKNIARPHDMPTKDNGLEEPKIHPHYGYPDYPDGQIRMPAADYARFLKVIVNKGMIDGKRIIKASLMEEFIRIQYPETAKHQAIAWNYNEFDNFIYYLLMPRLPSHTGADPGVATAVSFDPKTGHAGIIFTNSPPVKFVEQKVFYQEIMKRLLKEAKRASKE